MKSACSRGLLFIITLVSIGQGCVNLQSSLPTVEPIGTPTPEGFVQFREGFGAIPGPAPAPVTPRGATAVVTWSEEIPAIPNEVTIIRQRKSTPNTAILQNLTTALEIPAGALQTRPTTDELQIAWRDGAGYRWSFDARMNRVAFDRIEAVDRRSATTLPNDEKIISIATSFLDGRGVDIKTGEPFLNFSWHVWWHNEESNHRCMSAGTVRSMHEIADDDPTTFPSLPILPEREQLVTCESPVFPSLHLVNFHKVQDGQDVFGLAGSQLYNAQVVVNAVDGTAISGWFELQKDADRSNYPASSLEDVTTHLLLGGTNDATQFPSGTRIQIQKFSSVLLEHRTEVDGVARRFFIPAIRATGSVTIGQTKTPYTTLLPLLDLDSYAP